MIASVWVHRGDKRKANEEVKTTEERKEPGKGGDTEGMCQPVATGEVVVTEGGQMAPPVTTGMAHPSYIGSVLVMGAAQ